MQTRPFGWANIFIVDGRESSRRHLEESRAETGGVDWTWPGLRVNVVTVANIIIVQIMWRRGREYKSVKSQRALGDQLGRRSESSLIKRTNGIRKK